MSCFVLRFILIHLVLLNNVRQVCTRGSFNITVLHTNDLHGRYDEIDQSGFTCDASELKQKKCLGGVARLATVIKQVRNREENVVLLDGGDRLSGSIWTEVYRGNATRTFVNELNYTAVTLGNHDFDYGIPDLLHFLEGTECAVMVSNINSSHEPSWPHSKQLVKKSQVFDLGGQKVGIVGYVITSTGRTSNSGPNIQFLPIIESVQEAVTELTSRGITKIIAVGHAGFEVDKEIAKNVKGVDAVIGGHTNTFLYTGNPPSTEKPQGEYPYIVHPDHNASLSVPVVQAFAYSKYLGHLQLKFDEEGHVISWHGNPILMEHKVKKDPGVDSVVKKMKILVDHKGEVVIGQSKVKLDASNNVCANEQCVLGSVMTAAMVYHFRSDNAKIAVFSGGGIRASLPTDVKGNVLYKDLFDSFPYRNTIDLVELSGVDLMKGLQVSGFLQMKGLRVHYSPGTTGVQHLKQVEVQDSLCSSKNCYHPINMSQIYKVVVDSYLATSGNKVITEKKRSRVRGKAIYDVIVNYFRDNSPITAAEVNIAIKLEQSYVLFLTTSAWSILMMIYFYQ